MCWPKKGGGGLFFSSTLEAARSRSSLRRLCLVCPPHPGPSASRVTHARLAVRVPLSSRSVHRLPRLAERSARCPSSVVDQCRCSPSPPSSKPWTLKRRCFSSKQQARSFSTTRTRPPSGSIGADGPSPLFTPSCVSCRLNRSYVARFSYLQSKIFQCEFSGKSGQDYFTALASERAESRVVRERFPDELKARVLSTVQFREFLFPNFLLVAAVTRCRTPSSAVTDPNEARY